MSEGEKGLALKEKISYATALGGQNLMYNFVNFFIMIFYTDVLGILPAAAGTLFLVARIWDAVNDPIMGVVVDHTHSRLGKCRPFLIYMSLPIGLATAMLFFVPSLPPHGRLIYAWISYILWGMVYTSGDIPLWTLSGRISPRTGDRNTLISWARIAGVVAMAFAVLFTIPLKTRFGSDERGFFAVAIVYCLIGFAAIFQGGLFTRERALKDRVEERPELKDSLRAIFTNGPLLLVLLYYLLGVIQGLQAVVMMYFAKYNLQNEGLMMVIAAVTLAGSAVGMGLVPPLTRLMDSKKLVILSGFVMAVLGLLMYTVGYGNILLFFIFAAVWGVVSGLPEVIRTTMLANTVEWMEKKTGKRSDGTFFSTLTFIGKLTAGLGKFIVGIVLTIIGFKANAVQSHTSLNGIFMAMTLIPGLGGLIMVIPLMFYRIDDNTHRELVAELGLTEK